jgi:hypothetical protein
VPEVPPDDGGAEQHTVTPCHPLGGRTMFIAILHKSKDNVGGANILNAMNCDGIGSFGTYSTFMSRQMQWFLSKTSTRLSRRSYKAKITRRLVNFSAQLIRCGVLKWSLSFRI